MRGVTEGVGNAGYDFLEKDGSASLVGRSDRRKLHEIDEPDHAEPDDRAPHMHPSDDNR